MARDLFISPHAIHRYQERVANISDEAAHDALDTKAVRLAAQIGAPYVKLGTGHRIVVEDWVVVTVLPARHVVHRTSPAYSRKAG